jgi:hypothetical protein
VAINSRFNYPAGSLTEKVARMTERDIRNAHMLRTKCDEIPNRRVIIPFSVATKKLAA